MTAKSTVFMSSAQNDKIVIKNQLHLLNDSMNNQMKQLEIERS